MRVLTIGGGPAGLYASLLLKKARPDLDITVVERNPAGATYGWGVVFSDRTLSEFREADRQTSEAITDSFVLWDAIDVRYRDEVIRSGGHVFAGIARVTLLQILQRRCRELGVKLQFEEEATDLGELADHDLVIAADGVNSVARAEYEKVFRPRLETGQSRYIWFGTRRVLDAFTFIFRESEHGLFQVHSYPFDGETSTFIVETDEATLRRAGLDLADEAESIRYCERLFADDLRGEALMSNRSMWVSFVTVRNRTWRHGNVVLVGDAAHTAHFTIGSGTKLAMEDSIALANALERRGWDVDAALTDYELERRPVVERFQDAAAESREYFENTRRYLHLEPMPFAFHLLTRSGRIDYDNLRLRDPRYVDEVDRRFAGGGVAVAPPPMFAPLVLRSRTVPNRVVRFAGPTPSAVEGMPGQEHTDRVVEAARSGAGMVLTDIVAVSARGRITPGCSGLYRDEQAQSWRSTVDRAHLAGNALIAMQIGHAGRRGSTRPRHEGLDRPLRSGGWPLMAASPIPYTSRSRVPEEMVRGDMDRVRDEFVAAAERAADAGVDLLMVHMARGYLLAGFLSPLTNARTDEYGGSPENRMKFPLEVVEAVRRAWPADRPLGGVIPATDWVPGGFSVENAVALATMLRERGCDLLEPVAGQATPEYRPRFGRAFLAGYSDRVRNEARVATLTGGNITTTDQVNTLVAGGRADLCMLSRR